LVCKRYTGIVVVKKPHESRNTCENYYDTISRKNLTMPYMEKGNFLSMYRIRSYLSCRERSK